MTKLFNSPNIKFLFNYLKEYKLNILFQLLLAILSGGFAVGCIVFTQYAMSALFNSDWEKMCLICGTITAAYVFNTFINYFQYYLNTKLSQRVGKNIRLDLFYKFNRLPIKYYDTHNSGSTISMFNVDVVNTIALLSDAFQDFIGISVWIIGLGISMFIISWKLSLITIALTILIIFLLWYLTKKSQPFFDNVQESISNVTSYLNESLNNDTAIKMFNLEDEYLNKFDKLNSKLTKNNIKALFYSNAAFPTVEFATNIIIVLISAIGLIFISTNESLGGVYINLGVNQPIEFMSLTIFIILMRQFLSPFNQATYFVTILLTANAALKRICKLMNEPSEFDIVQSKNITQIAYDDYENTQFPILELNHVKFAYDDKNYVLDDISFKVNKSDFIGIVGPTGSGKSTIVNLITRMYEINSGEILLSNVNIESIKKEILRSHISLVPQETFLFDTSIMENIRVSNLNASDDQVIHAAKLANCHDLIMNLKDGYNTRINNNSTVLSKGERQLISIARALLLDAQIVILDEINGAIDPKTELRLEKAIKTIIDTKTVIMIAHKLSSVENANKIAVIYDGHLIEFGNHNELMDQNGFYYKLVNSHLTID